MIKVIKTIAEYEAALRMVNSLIELDPQPGSKEAEQLELLALLIKDYESKHFQLGTPSPIDAIRFRMDQEGLTNKDLAPFIGSRSKVSEVLSGKRPLTLPMIRALHTGLGIPADVLVLEKESLDEGHVEWGKFPIAEMAKRGWIDASRPVRELIKNPELALRDFVRPLGTTQRLTVLYRGTAHVRAGRAMDRYALAAWTVRIMQRANEVEGLPPYRPGLVTSSLMNEVARLSPFEDGPRRAVRLLADFGIVVIVEPQMPRTNLDGAAVLLQTGRPVVGLTLRHDRIDNFWFCLTHELAHIALHLSGTGGDPQQFFDDLEVGPGTDPREVEADHFAGESLIPEAEWNASAASKVRAVPAVLQLAHRLHIHPAIVAGRIRHQYKDFRVLGTLIGQGEVRRLFPEVTWP
jgi:HTH-type transcriptional regulator/antitoxin HigA